MRAATFALARTGRRALTTGSGPQLHRTSFYDHATTILSVRKGNEVVRTWGLSVRACARVLRLAALHARVCVCARTQVMIGDGQVTRGSTVVKPNARKVRRIGGGKVVVGFAGTAADGLALLEHLEAKLEEYPNQLMRASVAMAKMWRTDKYLRHLEALMIACDKDVSLTITGNGDVLEPHDGVIGAFARPRPCARVRALQRVSSLAFAPLTRAA